MVCGVPAKEGSYDEVHAFVVCAEDKREQTEEKLKEISSSADHKLVNALNAPIDLFDIVRGGFFACG